MLDMFGNLEEKQKEMAQKLAAIVLEESSEDGEVVVKVNANRKLVDLTLDREKLADADLEQIEDMVLVTINEALARAEVKAAAEARKSVQDMLPPGLGGLGDLFGS